MKIAIHNRPGSFSDRWIKYCKINNIPYKCVNAYDSDIINQLKDCDAFMWHHTHGDYRDVLFAKQLLFSVESSGLRVFPNFNTGWHFDDKVGQKYLLEAVEAPMVPSYVFYTKKEALSWIEKTDFPKVFKLRGGAGASNVKLAHTRNEAKKFVRKAFSSGFPQFDRCNYFLEKYKKWRSGKVSFIEVCKGLARAFIGVEFSKMHAPEKGYVYFQDFIPNNKFDIRVIIVDNKAFAFKRMCRKNDFRASGSGDFRYNYKEIDKRCIEIAFRVNERLKSSSIAYDFVFDENNNPLIVELSYGFIAAVYDKCEGYWDESLNFHSGNNFDFCGWMVESIIK